MHNKCINTYIFNFLDQYLPPQKGIMILSALVFCPVTTTLTTHYQNIGRDSAECR